MTTDKILINIDNIYCLFIEIYQQKSIYKWKIKANKIYLISLYYVIIIIIFRSFYIIKLSYNIYI